MGTKIAQTAVVDPRAKLGSNVRIGHFCVIGPDVIIGDDCNIEAHAVITGHTTLGAENHIFPGVVIGADPQDTSYKGAPTAVVIGDGNTFREYVTVNRATEKEDGYTRIGNNNYLMTHAHIAHDCNVGDRNVFANNVMIGGHAHIGNDITLAGGVGVSHFASIGSLSFVSAMSKVLHDVPPFMIVEGQPTKPRAVNSIGLKRHGFSSEDVAALTKTFRLLYRSYVGLEKAKEQMLTTGPIRPVLRTLFDFLENSVGGQKGRGRDRRRKAA